MEFIEWASFIEIYWYLVSLAHFITLKRTHLNSQLVFVLKWVKSVKDSRSLYSLGIIECVSFRKYMGQLFSLANF